MVGSDVIPHILACAGRILDVALRHASADQQWRMGYGRDRTVVSMVEIWARGRITSQCSGPGLAMLAPAADRER